jgi:acetyl-CoA acyltransferase
MPEAWIIDAVRTPMGSYGGVLAGVRPDDLGAVVLRALLERTGVPATDVEDVYLGCANQAGEDCRNVARMSALLAGFPIEVGACTVNRLCGSGMEAVAAALLLVSAEYAQAHGLRRLARIRSVGVAGVPPRTMGIGPVPATKKALARTGLALADLHRIELNEAFAAQSLAVLAGWELAADDPRVNASGGAIALGHPLGCSGARLLATLVHGLERTGQSLGLATMCIGVGQGIAMVVER